MKTKFCAALSLFALCAAPSTAVASPDPSPLEQYWMSFKEGNAQVDVEATLDAQGPVILDQVLNGLQVTLGWDSGSWWLDIEGVPVTDISTGADQWNRPTFAALYSGGVPGIMGFADVDNNGILVLQWGEIGQGTLRIQIDSNAAVGMVTCKCVGSGTVVLTCDNTVRTDCDDLVTCKTGTGGSSTAYCQWRAKTVEDN